MVVGRHILDNNTRILTTTHIIVWNTKLWKAVQTCHHKKTTDIEYKRLEKHATNDLQNYDTVDILGVPKVIEVCKNVITYQIFLIYFICLFIFRKWINLGKLSIGKFITKQRTKSWNFIFNLTKLLVTG